MKNQPDLSLTVGCIFLRFRVRSGYRTRQPGYNLRQRMTQQGIPSPFPDTVGYYWGVDQSTAFGFTLRKTEYPAMSWFGLGIPSCVVFPLSFCCAFSVGAAVSSRAPALSQVSVFFFTEFESAQFFPALSEPGPVSEVCAFAV